MKIIEKTKKKTQKEFYKATEKRMEEVNWGNTGEPYLNTLYPPFSGVSSTRQGGVAMLAGSTEVIVAVGRKLEVLRLNHRHGLAFFLCLGILLGKKKKAQIQLAAWN